MIDFDQLHEHAKRLADLTDPRSRHESLLTWGEFVRSHWWAIAQMWESRAEAGRIEDEVAQ